ncbi:DNA-directed RNA polymerase III subunit RPC5 [Boothiomyces sp. JEL0866]|nr:DNA-directed RNA polymerase III subunit RPC5 [Boothiomyces sp. JEL0866]
MVGVFVKEEPQDDVTPNSMVEDDPIVETYRINFTDTQNLLFLQFPTRSKPFTNYPTAARVKPNSNKLQVDLPLDNPAHYDEFRNQEYQTELKNIQLDSFQIPKNGKYMVGIFEDTLHLTEIKDIYQLRPTLSHIDKHQEAEKQLKLKSNFEDMKDINPNYEEEAKTIKMGNLENIQQLQLQQQTSREPWVELRINNPDSEDSKIQMDYLKQETELEMEELSNYLEEITSKDKDAPIFKSTMAFNETIGFTLHERLLALLLNCHAIGFSSIEQLFGNDPLDLISMLEQVAVVIRGNGSFISGIWIIKSRFLYKDRPLSARNYLLGQFLQNEYVRRSEFGQICKLPNEMSQNMLREIAVLMDDRKWGLKVAEEQDFSVMYSDVAERNSTNIMSDADYALGQMTGSLVKTTQKVTAKTRVVTSPVKYKIEGTNLQDRVESLIKQILAGGATRIAKIMDIFTQQIDLPKSKLSTATPELIQQQIQALCITIKDDIVVLKRSGNDMQDQFRYTAIAMFRQKDVLKKQELNQKWREEYGTQPQPALYSKIMQELAVAKNGGNWQLKS